MNDFIPDPPDPPDLSDERSADLCRRMEEHRDRQMHEAREWPPQESVVEQWEAHGLRCAIARGGAALCGYVHVPEDHPDAHLFYDDVDVSVHGGLTFRCKALDGGAWFGFDCAHYTDWFGFGNLVELSDAGVDAGVFEHPGNIWTVEEIRAETAQLAAQFAERARVNSDGIES